MCEALVSFDSKYDETKVRSYGEGSFGVETISRRLKSKSYRGFVQGSCGTKFPHKLGSGELQSINELTTKYNTSIF